MTRRSPSFQVCTITMAYLIRSRHRAGPETMQARSIEPTRVIYENEVTC